MLDWLDVLKISGPVAVAVTGLLGNEYFKRKWEKYKRKEERYVAMLESLKGFAVNADPRTAEKDKNEFIRSSIPLIYIARTRLSTLLMSFFLRYTSERIERRMKNRRR